MKQPPPAVPGTSNRVVIIGATGTGKSVAGGYRLLRYREIFTEFPWVIFNPKRDKMLDSIGAEPAELRDGLGKKPPEGMKIFHPVPDSDDDSYVNEIIEQALWHENVGLYFDEGYSIPERSKAFRRAQTQGRSKNVPVITCTQRPVCLDTFVFSEASFYQVFDLVRSSDKKTVKENTEIDLSKKLPQFHSHWYQVNDGRRFIFSPCPGEGEILQRFRALTPPKKKGFLQWLS